MKTIKKQIEVIEKFEISGVITEGEYSSDRCWSQGSYTVSGRDEEGRKFSIPVNKDFYEEYIKALPRKIKMEITFID